MNPMRNKINGAYGLIIRGIPSKVVFVLRVKSLGLKYIPETLLTKQANIVKKQRNLVAKNNEKSLF